MTLVGYFFGTFRDKASSIIIQIVTGVEVTIGNCFPEVGEILADAEANFGETISSLVTSTPVTVCIIDLTNRRKRCFGSLFSITIYFA